MIDAAEANFVVVEDPLEALVVILVGVRDDGRVKAELVLELTESPFQKAEHVVRHAGVDDDDSLVGAGLGGNVDATVALPDVEEDDLDRPLGDDVLGADE